MRTANSASRDGNYEKYYTATCFDTEVLAKVKNLFEEYRKRGVILNDSFFDDEWRLTNQLCTMTISFRVSELQYLKNTKPWLGCDYNAFLSCTKTYAIFLLGSVSIETIREIVREFLRITEMTEDDVLRASFEYPMRMVEFLTLLPDESARRDAVVEILEEKVWSSPARSGKRRQRVLAALGTYFKFNDAIQDFWASATAAEKLFWFPLYLWWTLTAILPLRTTEFLLTPRKCLNAENGKTLITLRRTLQKGGGRTLAYRIDADYEAVRYVIPDKMANEITWYLKATDSMEETTLGTLFAREPHYAHFEKKPYRSLGYYTYANLSTCLRCFQRYVMGVSDNAGIHLGDTRHLAMISLILSGGSPLICKELAGHADINISAHYYSNISTFVECATFEMHRKSRTISAEFLERSALTPEKREQSIPVQDGFCDSKPYGRGEIDDCIKSISPSGELGDCRRCPHFIDGKSGMHFLYANPAARKEQVDRDSQYLLQALEAVRSGIGLPENIHSALLQLQQSGTWYGRSLQNEWRVNGYGKTEKNDDRKND